MRMCAVRALVLPVRACLMLAVRCGSVLTRSSDRQKCQASCLYSIAKDMARCL